MFSKAVAVMCGCRGGDVWLFLWFMTVAVVMYGCFCGGMAVAVVVWLFLWFMIVAVVMCGRFCGV